MKIAVLTSEFPGQDSPCGGLGRFLELVSRGLTQLNHEVVVFCPGDEVGERLDEHGFRVVSAPAVMWRPLRLIRKLWRLGLGSPWWETDHCFRMARGLIKALEEEAVLKPFDLVLGTNLGLASWFVKPRHGRNCIWISAANDLWDQADGVWNQRDKRIRFWFECRLMRRAEKLLCPSRAIQKHFKEQYGIDSDWVPAPCEVKLSKESGDEKILAKLPERYLIHFGQIGTRKGSKDLAEALPRVWEACPDFRMVWAGPEIHEGTVSSYRALWGERADHILVLGPLARPDLNSCVKDAEASVLPSRVDNFPNTALESLVAGVPVITVEGNSVDELVENGVTGTIVRNGDPAALATALIAAWNKPLSCDDSAVSTLLSKHDAQQVAARVEELCVV